MGKSSMGHLWLLRFAMFEYPRVVTLNSVTSQVGMEIHPRWTLHDFPTACLVKPIFFIPWRVFNIVIVGKCKFTIFFCFFPPCYHVWCKIHPAGGLDNVIASKKRKQKDGKGKSFQSSKMACYVFYIFGFFSINPHHRLYPCLWNPYCWLVNSSACVFLFSTNFLWNPHEIPPFYPHAWCAWCAVSKTTLIHHCWTNPTIIVLLWCIPWYPTFISPSLPFKTPWFSVVFLLIHIPWYVRNYCVVWLYTNPLDYILIHWIIIMFPNNIAIWRLNTPFSIP